MYPKILLLLLLEQEKQLLKPTFGVTFIYNTRHGIYAGLLV